MRSSRRHVLTAGATAIVGLSGLATAVENEDGDTTVNRSGATASRDVLQAEEIDAAVTFMRNVEEVRGHLDSSAALLEQARVEQAALHAGHGSDYYAPVLTPLRDVNPELATRLRGRIGSLEAKVRSSDPEEYRTYLDEELFPLLEQAVEAVVPSAMRASAAFDVRVMNVLAGRIADEYTAAVPTADELDLVGEYWDGRGFLTRIEARYERVDADLGERSQTALSTLRSEMEGLAEAGAVREATLVFRIATTAATPLPDATVEEREQAVVYARNLDELRGHLISSLNLLEAGDTSGADLHAGHGGDYMLALLPAVRRADATLADKLLDRLLDAPRRAEEAPGAYAAFLEEQVFPLLNRVPTVALPADFRSDTAFDAAVLLALADRLEEEYEAAVTDEEVIELYGEYWDARGFLTRIEARFEAIEATLDGEAADDIASELGILSTELETAATPDDVAGSVAALEDALEEIASGS